MFNFLTSIKKKSHPRRGMVKKEKKISLKNHCLIGFIIRLILIFIGLYQDEYHEVKYTDVDYKVFSDAGRHIVNLKSPYNCQTYRYSPLIAYILVPNIFTYQLFGKIFFSFIDTLVTDLIYRILRFENQSKNSSKLYSLLWLYNPLSIIISTRGNCDSISSLLVLITIWFFYKKQFIYCGLIHGLSVHFRLYPIVFSLPLYMSIDNNYSIKIFKYLFPSKNRIKLTLSTVFSLTFITAIFYYLYGYEFLYETYIYHFKRVDYRHNYSVYFYLQYLSYKHGLSKLSQFMILFPQLILLLLMSIFFGNKKDLPFCLLCQTFILVTFNRVLTCQYFIWYLSLLPLCLPYMHFKMMELALVGNFWIIAQIAWLLPAYLLEFRSKQTFFFIWIQCIVFFWANIIVLSSFIRNYRAKKKIE